jgi:iron complex outermembrane receptor protein
MICYLIGRRRRDERRAIDQNEFQAEGCSLKKATENSGRVRAPAICLLGASLAAFAMSAQAQQKPKDPAAGDEPIQEVVVTGSKIARPDLDRLEPTTTIDSKTFDTRGYLDVGAALAESPAFGTPPSSSANTQSGFGIAQSFVDLYGLGSQRTLTLVNGRRFVSSSTASLNNAAGLNSATGSQGSQVDLNVIPTKLIDHVETISVGGAPIYGADAVAGTVNIILKKDFQGLDMDAQVGASGRGDAWNYRGRILAGTNFFEDRGNVTVVGELTKTDGLIGTSRPDYARDLFFLAPATPGKYQQVLGAPGAVQGINYSGIPYVDDGVYIAPSVGYDATKVGVTNAAGEVLAWKPGGGNLAPYNPGTPTGNPVFSFGGDGERLSQVSNLLAPTERINVDSVLNFKLTDTINLFGEGWFSETHATNLLSQPSYNTALFGTAGSSLGDFAININNPYLTSSDRTLIQTALNNYAAAIGAGNGFGANGGAVSPTWNNSTFYVARASTDIQSGEATGTQVLARGVLGVNGNFEFADRKYNWEVAGIYGSSSATQVTPSYVSQNVQNAVNATTNAAGQIVCAGAPAPSAVSTLSSTCAPLNVFGQGSPSLASRDYVTHLATAKSFNTQRDFTANLNGDVMRLPGGEWKASVGFENRRESADFTPDSFYLLGLGENSEAAVSGAYHTNEFSAETVVPIFGGDFSWPGLQHLEYNGAVRRVDNSIAGNAVTYTNGLIYNPVQDVQFRINKTKSIRAPSITELFLPSATSMSFANDPCDHNYVNQGTAPATRAANCAAAGINTSTFSSNVVNATATGTSSGNTGLKSETAASITYGVVLRPRFVPRLNITFDYVNIHLSNAIETLTLTDNLDACYDSSSYPTAAACSAFTRNAAGQITSYHVGYVNAGLLQFVGYPVAVDYNFDLPMALGNLSARASWLDTGTLRSQIGEASAESLAGEFAGNGNVKRKGTLNVLYTNGGFGWDVFGQYTGAVNFDNQNTATSQNYLSVARWWLFNTTVSYRFNDHVSTQFIVNNVFDKQPPFPALAGTGGNFVNQASIYFAGILGRSMVASVNVKF